MRTNAAAEADLAAEVAPPVEPSAPWRVTAIRIVEHGVLDVHFVDKTHGRLDMRAFLASETATGTVFEPLRDASVFSLATVHLGAVEWPGEADLAPDAMYDNIQAHGTWVFD